jgi:hypothetical protein
MKFIRWLLKLRRDNALFGNILAYNKRSAFRCGNYQPSTHDKNRNDKKVDKRYLYVPSFRLPGYSKSREDNTGGDEQGGSPRDLYADDSAT